MTNENEEVGFYCGCDLARIPKLKSKMRASFLVAANCPVEIQLRRSWTLPVELDDFTREKIILKSQLRNSGLVEEQQEQRMGGFIRNS
jgi:hypothetical protein